MENNFCIGIDKSIKSSYLASVAYQEGLSFLLLDSISEGIEKGIRVFFWNSVLDVSSLLNQEIFLFTDNFYLESHLALDKEKAVKSTYFRNEYSAINFKTQFLLERDILPLRIGNQIGVCVDSSFQVIPNSGVVQYRKDNINYLSFPWRISQEIIGETSRYRPFYSRVIGKFYCEVGPSIDYNVLRKFVMHMLVYSFNSLGLPLIRRKNFTDHTPSYSIRIDADGFSHSSVNAVLDVTAKTNKRFHWFIDVYSWCKHGGIHAVKLLHSRNQDVQIHSFRHMTFNSYLNNLLNIWTAIFILKIQGLRAHGVVSPFGFYNFFFQKAMKSLKIKYTSEFGFNVNDIAIYPHNDSNYPLQIPTHNASITTLKMSDFTPEETFHHLKESIEELATQNGYAILYEHPILGIEQYLSEYTKLIEDLDSKLTYSSIGNYAEKIHFMYKELESPLYLNKLSKDLVYYNWYAKDEDKKELKKFQNSSYEYWIPYEKIGSNVQQQLVERNTTFERHFSKEYHSGFIRWFFIWYIRSLAVAIFGALRKKA